jgi:hypothetical protein
MSRVVRKTKRNNENDSLLEGGAEEAKPEAKPEVKSEKAKSEAPKED